MKTNDSELAGSFCKKHAVTHPGDRIPESRFQKTLRVLASGVWPLASGVGLRPFVSMWFQNYFIPLIGVLFTFPSRYWFTIGERTYLAFGATLDTALLQCPTSWFVVLRPSDRISPVLPYLRGTNVVQSTFAYWTFTLFGGAFQPPSAQWLQCPTLGPVRARPGTSCNPKRRNGAHLDTSSVWALSAFARHY